MTYKIENGIPLPDNKLNSTTRWLHKIEVGDSFLIQGAYSADSMIIKGIRSWGRRQNPPRAFVARQQIGGGVRVWRAS